MNLVWLARYIGGVLALLAALTSFISWAPGIQYLGCVLPVAFGCGSLVGFVSASYLKRFQGRDLKTLLIWASHDSTFLPVYSRQVLESFRELDLPHKVFNLPCGHYTTGQFPFNLLDGLVMCRFAARNL